MKKLNLISRSGPSPTTTKQLPHSQLNQHGPDNVIDQLHEFCFSLPGVLNEPSRISVPGSRALVLSSNIQFNSKAFMVGREFAHIHPHPDSGSMHLKLPPAEVGEVIKQGWGENHYLVDQGYEPIGLIMVFSPRDQTEFEVVKSIVNRSYEYAINN